MTPLAASIWVLCAKCPQRAIELRPGWGTVEVEEAIRSMLDGGFLTRHRGDRRYRPTFDACIPAADHTAQRRRAVLPPRDPAVAIDPVYRRHRIDEISHGADAVHSQSAASPKPRAPTR